MASEIIISIPEYLREAESELYLFQELVANRINRVNASIAVLGAVLRRGHLDNEEYAKAEEAMAQLNSYAAMLWLQSTIDEDYPAQALECIVQGLEQYRIEENLVTNPKVARDTEGSSLFTRCKNSGMDSFWAGKLLQTAAHVYRTSHASDLDWEKNLVFAHNLAFLSKEIFDFRKPIDAKELARSFLLLGVVNLESYFLTGEYQSRIDATNYILQGVRLHEIMESADFGDQETKAETLLYDGLVQTVEAKSRGEIRKKTLPKIVDAAKVYHNLTLHPGDILSRLAWTYALLKMSPTGTTGDMAEAGRKKAGELIEDITERIGKGVEYITDIPYPLSYWDSVTTQALIRTIESELPMEVVEPFADKVVEMYGKPITGEFPGAAYNG